MKRGYSTRPWSRGWLLRLLRDFRFEDCSGPHVAKWAVIFMSKSRGLDLLLHSGVGETQAQLLKRVRAEIDSIEARA